ncbi:hypothetical protein WG66_004110 [Moniliophthora roreri]|nr:hypothetical protein WG66_004110 [Moniliophthora roreri]
MKASNDIIFSMSTLSQTWNHGPVPDRVCFRIAFLSKQLQARGNVQHISEVQSLCIGDDVELQHKPISQRDNNASKHSQRHLPQGGDGLGDMDGGLTSPNSTSWFTSLPTFVDSGLQFCSPLNPLSHSTPSSAARAPILIAKLRHEILRIALLNQIGFATS